MSTGQRKNMSDTNPGVKEKNERDKTQKMFSINYINHKLEVTY